MTIVYVDETESTNSLVAQSVKHLAHGTAVAAHSQTRGRGQRGNSWESEPRKNLTFSLLLRPQTIAAVRQFELSQVVSIAIANVLREELRTQDVVIKWPNDIYYKDKKICGILIENSLLGHNIDYAIAGIGINVNQTEFVSDAPNPTSMALISGHQHDLDALLDKIVKRIVDDFDNYEAYGSPTHLAALYRSMLWRGEGFWPYRDNMLDEVFTARIAAVSPTGHLTLQTDDGHFFTFAFKEVSPIL